MILHNSHTINCAKLHISYKIKCLRACLKTEGAVLWRIGTSRSWVIQWYEKGGGGLKVCRVVTPHSQFHAECAIQTDLLFCTVTSFGNVSYVVTHWHIINRSSRSPGCGSLDLNSYGLHCVSRHTQYEDASSSIISHIAEIHVSTALYGLLKSTVEAKSIYWLTYVFWGCCSVYATHIYP
jgi:hypothetical protein